MSSNNADPLYVTSADLPLCCPPRQVDVWNQHPRVYLPIEQETQVTCPYCSATYILKKELKK